MNLACEHIGIERSRADSFFDGTLGNRLVKVIPFHHPLTPIDLEELKRELDSRPDEDRGVVLVCLGKELAADAWLEEWNRLRTGKNAINRIEVIELRTDPKYGRFIAHEPATVDVSVTRDGNLITVEITDFISPSIVKRLDLDHTIFKAKITDWRSMVDCVMIDTGYNGEVFRVALSDVPPTKDDFVQGTYRLETTGSETTVAVKIIDMLGEEIIVTRPV